MQNNCMNRLKEYKAVEICMTNDNMHPISPNNYLSNNTHTNIINVKVGGIIYYLLKPEQISIKFGICTD